MSLAARLLDVRLALRVADQVLMLGNGLLSWKGATATFATADKARETWVAV